MLNQVILVGKMNKAPYFYNTEDGEMKGKVTIEIRRPYSPELDEIMDELVVEISGTMAEHILDYSKVGAVLGFKASLRPSEDGLLIIADKVTFINTRAE